MYNHHAVHSHHCRVRLRSARTRNGHVLLPVLVGRLGGWYGNEQVILSLCVD